MSLQVVRVESKSGLVGVDVVHDGHVEHFHAARHTSSERHIGPLQVESSAGELCRRVILDSDDSSVGD